MGGKAGRRRCRRSGKVQGHFPPGAAGVANRVEVTRSRPGTCIPSIILAEVNLVQMQLAIRDETEAAPFVTERRTERATLRPRDEQFRSVSTLTTNGQSPEKPTVERGGPTTNRRRKKLPFPCTNSWAICPLVVDGDGRSRHPNKSDLSVVARLCRVPALREPALPALRGRSNLLSGPKWFWVGHSGERFVAGPLSDQGPGACTRPLWIPPAGGPALRTAARQGHSPIGPHNRHIS